MATEYTARNVSDCVIADQKDVPREALWDTNGVYDGEKQRVVGLIKNEIRKTALDSPNKESTLKILAQVLDFKPLYTKQRGSAHELDNAQNGLLKKYCPTDKQLLSWLLGTIAATLVELGILGIIVTMEMGGEGAFVLLPLLPVIALAVGSWFAGMGLGGLIHWKKYGQSNKEELDLQTKILFGVGVGIVLAVLIIRIMAAAKGSTTTVALITIAFSLIIIIPDAIHHNYAKTKEHYMFEMFQVQQFIADRAHKKDAQEKTWETFYTNLVNNS
jgi:hypothetical protein